MRSWRTVSFSASTFPPDNCEAALLFVCLSEHSRIFAVLPLPWGDFEQSVNLRSFVCNYFSVFWNLVALVTLFARSGLSGRRRCLFAWKDAARLDPLYTYSRRRSWSDPSVSAGYLRGSTAIRMFFRALAYLRSTSTAWWGLGAEWCRPVACAL